MRGHNGLCGAAGEAGVYARGYGKKHREVLESNTTGIHRCDPQCRRPALGKSFVHVSREDLASAWHGTSMLKSSSVSSSVRLDP